MYFNMNLSGRRKQQIDANVKALNGQNLKQNNWQSHSFSKMRSHSTVIKARQADSVHF